MCNQYRLSIEFDTSERESKYLEGQIPHVPFFTLSIVGNMILNEGLLDSRFVLQQPHCEKICSELLNQRTNLS